MIKRRVEELLYEKRMTQADLADAIGLTPATLSRNINGLNSPKADVVRSIASFFNVTTDYLLGLSNNRYPNIEKKSLDEQLAEEMDGFQFALYDEVNDLTDEQKEDLLQMVRIFKKNLRK